MHHIDTEELYGRMEAFKRYGQESDRVAIWQLMEKLVRQKGVQMKEAREKAQAGTVGEPRLRDAVPVTPRDPLKMALVVGSNRAAPPVTGKKRKKTGRNRSLVMAFVSVEQRRGRATAATVYIPSVGRSVTTTNPQKYILASAPSTAHFVVVVRGVSPFRRHPRITVKPYHTMSAVLRAYYLTSDPRVEATARALGSHGATIKMADVYNLLCKCFHSDGRIMGFLRDA